MKVVDAVAIVPADAREQEPCFKMSDRPTLRQMKPGESGRVAGFEAGHRSYRRKLLAMGLTPGVEFQVLRFAPLGDPVEIRVRGFDLSLRCEEADVLLIDRQ